MTASTFTVQRATRCNAPRSAPRTDDRGFTYLALLAAIIIIGIVMASAGTYWQSVMRREKEEELLFRGGQYRAAIERYYYARSPNVYPQNIDDLLKDNRTAKGRRHLRQKFKDPITGEDFEIIRDITKGNRITGVFSNSDLEPLRQTGFPDEDREFEGKKQYRDWKFLFAPQQATPGALPLRPAAAGAPAPTATPPGAN